MRIVQVANVRWFNATAWYALYLARLLQDAGHESVVLALEGTETHHKALDWGLDVRTYPLNSNNPLVLAGLYHTLRRFVDQFAPHAVNCHRGESFWLWSLLRRSRDFRLIRTRGDQRLPKNNFSNRWLHNTVADAVITTNSVMHRHFLDAFGIAQQRLHLILGGVDKERFTFSEPGRSSVRAEFGYKEDDFVVGLLGRFDEVKGQRELIEAVASLRAQGLTHIKLMLLGFETATTQARVETWIRDSGMQDHTVITGNRQDVTHCISALDLGVIASKWSEAIARAALEIMSCNRPLVSTTVGVMPDLLGPEALFAPADVGAMAQSIGRAAQEAEFVSALQATQSQRIATLGGEDFLRQTLAVYQEGRA